MVGIHVTSEIKPLKKVLLHRPEKVRLSGDIDTFTNMLWNSLNEDNKVSLFVREIELKTGKCATRIVNKYEKV